MNPDKNRFEPLLNSELITPDSNQELTTKLFEQMRDADRASLVRPDGSPVPEHWPIFKVGEELIIKGYVFRVGYIGETTLLLEPVRVAP